MVPTSPDSEITNLPAKPRDSTGLARGCLLSPSPCPPTSVMLYLVGMTTQQDDRCAKLVLKCHAETLVLKVPPAALLHLSALHAPGMLKGSWSPKLLSWSFPSCPSPCQGGGMPE